MGRIDRVQEGNALAGRRLECGVATPILVEDIEGCGPRYARVKQGFTNGISDSVIAGAVVASV